MAGFLNVTRFDTDGKQMLVINSYRDKAYNREAEIIAPGLLAKLKIASGVYHIIHIPTGYVIAQCDGTTVPTVKKTFMAQQWIVRDNTLVMIPEEQNKYQKLYNHEPMRWEINCLIKYTLERIDDTPTNVTTLSALGSTYEGT